MGSARRRGTGEAQLARDRVVACQGLGGGVALVKEAPQAEPIVARGDGGGGLRLSGRGEFLAEEPSEASSEHGQGGCKEVCLLCEAARKPCLLLWVPGLGGGEDDGAQTDDFVVGKSGGGGDPGAEIGAPHLEGPARSVVAPGMAEIVGGHGSDAEDCVLAAHLPQPLRGPGKPPHRDRGLGLVVAPVVGRFPTDGGAHRPVALDGVGDHLRGAGGGQEVRDGSAPGGGDRHLDGGEDVRGVVTAVEGCVLEHAPSL